MQIRVLRRSSLWAVLEKQNWQGGVEDVDASHPQPVTRQREAVRAGGDGCTVHDVLQEAAGRPSDFIDILVTEPSAGHAARPLSLVLERLRHAGVRAREML